MFASEMLPGVTLGPPRPLGVHSGMSGLGWPVEIITSRLSPFQILEATYIPRLMAPSSIFKTGRVAPSNGALILSPLPPSYKDPWEYHGPTQIIQDSLPIQDT